MPSPVMLQILITLFGLAFSAGGAWVMLKEAQRHVNGLGAKVNKNEEIRADRDRRLSLAVLAVASNEEQRASLLKCLTGDSDK